MLIVSPSAPRLLENFYHRSLRQPDSLVLHANANLCAPVLGWQMMISELSDIIPEGPQPFTNFVLQPVRAFEHRGQFASQPRHFFPSNGSPSSSSSSMPTPMKVHRSEIIMLSEEAVVYCPLRLPSVVAFARAI